MPHPEEWKLLSHEETVRVEALAQAVSFVDDTSTKPEDVVRVAAVFERWIREGETGAVPAKLVAVSK